MQPFQVVGGDGFEPPKASPADLQSAPFGHSGNHPSHDLQWKNKRSMQSLLSDSNQRPRDYKSRALANWAKEANSCSRLEVGKEPIVKRLQRYYLFFNRQNFWLFFSTIPVFLLMFRKLHFHCVNNQINTLFKGVTSLRYKKALSRHIHRDTCFFIERCCRLYYF